jgi:hypothetical protein
MAEDYLTSSAEMLSSVHATRIRSRRSPHSCAIKQLAVRAGLAVYLGRALAERVVSVVILEWEERARTALVGPAVRAELVAERLVRGSRTMVQRRSPGSRFSSRTTSQPAALPERGAREALGSEESEVLEGQETPEPRAQTAARVAALLVVVVETAAEEATQWAEASGASRTQRS